MTAQPARITGARTGAAFGRAVPWALRFVALALLLLPCLWMAGAAFMPTLERLDHPLRIWPAAPTFEHFASVWSNGIGAPLFNSLLVGFGTTLLALALAFPAAYALVRLRFPARLDLLFLVLVLALKLMPPITIAVPLFALAKRLHLLDSTLGLMLAYQIYALPMAIWMLLAFVRDVPIEYEEAACIDGAGLARRLVQIVLPLCAPG